MPRIHERLAIPHVRGRGKRSPALVILGARQTGKSTLARAAFPEHAFFDLEDPRDDARIDRDPLFALSEHRHIVIDEVQRRPELFADRKSEAGKRPIRQGNPARARRAEAGRRGAGRSSSRWFGWPKRG